MAPASLAPGFADPPAQAQIVFRAVLDAMSRPGTIADIGEAIGTAPPPLDAAAFALALTLIDFETPLWLDRTLGLDAVAAGLRFHCGCPIVEKPKDAAFALIGDPAEAPPLPAFRQGTPDYPDRSCTVIMQVGELRPGGGLCLSGPGIAESAMLGIDGLPSTFESSWGLNHRQFPLGVDLIFTAGRRLAALPRSIRLEA